MGNHDDDLQVYVVEHLDEAIENGWVCAYYQPVIRTVSGKICGMEALARWDDPVHGLLSPAVFIPALEHARLIHKLDICVVREACQLLRANIDAGKPVVPVSFNLSRLDFDLCDIHRIIENTVREFEVPRSFVNIEITESVFGADLTFMATVIDRFHDIGYQVWMDDFGSAYSSLNVLKNFEFDEMKIDLVFLRDFNERSRAIVASVVDMAKRLGIQTLAEGVETREHAEFLHHIGCEKQQGYFYGKPEPYSDERLEALSKEFGIEEQGERRYYRAIGSVNALSLSERDFMAATSIRDYVTSMPLAFVEYDGELFSVLDYNEPFAEALGAVGIESVEVAERLINDTSRPSARTARRLVETIERDEFSRQDYTAGGFACVMRTRFIARYENRITVLLTLDSAARTSEHQRRERMDKMFEVIYSIYEHVDVIHLDEGYVEPIFTQASFTNAYDFTDLSEAVCFFADHEVFSADRARYIEFMNISTMLDRIEAGGQNYIVGFFRMRDRGGDYAWKLIALIHPSGQSDQNDREIIICIRDTNWDNDALFQAAYESGESRSLGGPGEIVGEADLRVTDGSLWRSLMNDPQLALFWKDTDRRFIGCNEAFLNYYGFDSPDVLIGKTDEDMGWHVDPVPYMQDEQRVINEGASTEDVVGHCIAHGEVRSIMASKRPVYRNGRIVGLVGRFLDISDVFSDERIERLSYTDPVTDMLNYSGLEAMLWRYIDAYKKTDSDFYALLLDIEDFKHYNERHGYDFGDKVLHHVGELIREVVGVQCVAAHIYADRYVVLRQGVTRADADLTARDIVEALGTISEVDGIRCTVYAQYAIVAFSEAGDIDELKRLGRTRLHEAKGR